MAMTLEDGGKKLLESGYLADVTVECGNRVWKLHKVVLVTRSEWFKAALSGDTQEAKDNKIVIRGQDPEHVDWIIIWIYTHRLEAPVLSNRETMHQACLQLYLTADVFALAGLQKSLKTRIKHQMLLELSMTMDKFVPGKYYAHAADETKAAYIGFFRGVHEAFLEDIDWAKRQYVKFVAATNYGLFCNNTFRDCCKEIPEYFDSLVDGFVITATNPHWNAFVPLDNSHDALLELFNAVNGVQNHRLMRED
ncbi:BTB/POZ protein [Hypoxylon trugodes]|uniref:BTB/POZ protein n=1 Tax=Hypoxylon trugodes TaxID=326681 RepID=UPI00218CB2D9|nr:BTB/POZ protein [Hypoxylon trugodes]KAI1392127.1 BTB/POZ protein [Hypoxylon trugodes]